MWLSSVWFSSVQEQVEKMVAKMNHIWYMNVCDEWEFTTYRIVHYVFLMTLFKCNFAFCSTGDMNGLKIKGWEFCPQFSVSSRVIRKGSDRREKKLWYNVMLRASLSLLKSPIPYPGKYRAHTIGVNPAVNGRETPNRRPRMVFFLASLAQQDDPLFLNRAVSQTTCIDV